MQPSKSLFFYCTLILWVCSAVSAQQAATSSTTSVVPRLVNFSARAFDDQGKPLAGISGITFSIYKDQSGGAPLWMETQNVNTDARGNYTVQLGATSAEGLPLDVFASGEARWLGVRVNGGEEQPRVLLLSVPYALKAADAQTLGGLPASAFVLAGAANPAAVQTNVAGSAQSSPPPPSTSDVTTTGGTVNTLPLFTTTTNVQSSILTQTGSGTTGKIGINTATPTSTLDVNGTATIRGTLSLPATGAASTTAGKNSQPTTLTASAFNSSTSSAVPQKFQWQAEPAGNNTTAPSGTLNLLYSSGTAVPSETGLKIAKNGRISFAAGQTFPIATGGVTNAMLQNSSVTITPGTALTGGGKIALGGSATLNLDTTKVPLLAAANVFTNNQAITGNLMVSSIGYIPILEQGPESGVGAALEMQTTGSGGMYWQILNTGTSSSQGPNKLNFRNDTGGLDVMTMTASGQVGIGTTVPHYRFEIDGPPYLSSPVAVVGFGFNGPAGSGQMGTDAVWAVGGAGDPNNAQNNGNGIYGVGGNAGQDASDGVGGYFVGGGYAAATVTGSGDAVFGYPGTGYAGLFQGDVFVEGNLSKNGGSFKIDHPLDPANKYLYHSFVESPDMMNIYNGLATLDAKGEATIQMPGWFDALNRDFRYQLTCIGGFAPVYIAEELTNNEFKIGGGRAGMRVSWQITGIRQDAWANAHRIPVEEEKDARLKGFYIHPELYGAPPEKQIDWVRHPQMMKQLQQKREQMKDKQARLTQSLALPQGSTK